MIAALLLNIYYLFLTALTPHQKFTAMRQLNTSGGSNLWANKWFALLWASVAVILTIVLLAIRRMRIERESEASDRRFTEEADRLALNDQERKLLSEIAEHARIRRKETIFTATAVFNRGAARVLQESFTTENVQERKNLNHRVNMLREKLGYKKRTYSFGVGGSRSKSLSSRQIIPGKKVSLAPANKPNSSRIEGVVVRNEELEFLVCPEIAVRSSPGEIWSVHYRFGAAMWEFDALTVSCGDDGLMLSHSDNIRFINRRRFLRVSVEKPALMAPFPMTLDGFEGEPNAPEFVPATVVELSGPGLSLKADIKVNNGDRILVIFELEKGKIIEDIAEVRGQRDTKEGRYIGVELVGLNDVEIDELIRVTNSTAINHSVKEAERANELVENRANG